MARQRLLTISESPLLTTDQPQSIFVYPGRFNLGAAPTLTFVVAEDAVELELSQSSAFFGQLVCDACATLGHARLAGEACCWLAAPTGSSH
eukprot:SAG31_NODE_22690_length_520_cov_0.719715_1_plen_90_part_01